MGSAVIRATAHVTKSAERLRVETKSTQESTAGASADVVPQHVHAIHRTRHTVALSIVRQRGDQSMASLSFAHSSTITLSILSRHLLSNRHAALTSKAEASSWDLPQRLDVLRENFFKIMKEKNFLINFNLFL